MASTKQKSGAAWYGGGLRFECERCGRCCGGEPGDVFITPDEVDRVAAKLGLSVEEFTAGHLRFTRRGASLAERPNGDCVLLPEPDGGGGGGGQHCTVYDARPMQCRMWPFWRENLTSHVAWNRAAVDCPGMSQGRLHAPGEIESLRF